MKNDKLRLWVDGQCLQTASRMRGIGRYVQEFLTEIAENHREVDLHVSLNAAMAPQAMAVRESLQNWIAPCNIHVWQSIEEGPEHLYGYSDRRKLSEIALCYHVSSIKPDVALSVSPFEDYAVPLLPNDLLRVPTASIFYDAIPLRYPKQYLKSAAIASYYQRRLLSHKGFDINLCISEFSQKEITEILREENSVNIGAGVSKYFINGVMGEPGGCREENTLLYVGGFDWRKNVPRVIDAIAMLRTNLRSKIKFVIIGDVDKGTEEELKCRWDSAGLPEYNLHLTGHVSDEALVHYYRRVSAVIQPSMMEGFGLTALEAILCDTPVIASQCGAIPEIVLDKARLFDPTNTQDIANHIQQVFDDILQGRGVARDVKEHAKSFTWKTTVDRALEALRQIAGDPVKQPWASLDDLQQQIVTKVAPLKLPASIKIECLSRAQEPAQQYPRLIVDATVTTISNAGTGIQRVVTKICDQIVKNSNQSIDSIIAFTDPDTGWYSVPDGNLNLDPSDIINQGEKIFLGGHDHVLMLDSTWLYYAQHSTSLKYGRLRGTQVTSCLYDLVPLKMPGYTHAGMPAVFSQWFRAALTYSTGFVCISKAVADELIALLDAINFPKPLKIGYWPLGADFSDPGALIGQDEKPNTSRPVFLMVGTLEPRKGHKVALDAFNLLWQRGVDVQLMIVGKLGWNAKHFVERMQSHPEWNKRLFWDSKATDAELQAYYTDCNCLISTSFAEGFGLPIIEAGYFDKPVIASDIPVFREVSSKSRYSLFFEMGNAAALADAVEKVINEGGTAIPNIRPDQGWVNWAGSAAALKKVVIDGDWYHVYQPKEARPFVDVAEALDIRMKRPLESCERQFELSFVDGPLSTEVESEVRYIIKVTNLSETIWSSLGSQSRENIMNLASRLVDREGNVIEEGRRSNIPFVIVPQDTIYMPIDIPIYWGMHSDAEIHVELVQEGGGWWGSPVIIAVKTIK